MPGAIERIILVYNGDSGLGAMLLDIVKKAAGREDCALCEIIYSPVGKRGAWAACQRRLGIPVEELHRDELPPAWGVAHSELPCILARVGEARPFVLLTRAEIIACSGRVADLERRLQGVIKAHETTATEAQP